MSENGAEGQLRRRAEEASAPPPPPARQPLPPRVPVERAPKVNNTASGYWSFVMLAIFLLFIFYVTGKGELQQWLQVLVPNPPVAPKSSGAGQTPAAGGSTPATPASATTPSSSGGNTPPSGGSPPTQSSPSSGGSTGNAWGGWIKYWTGILTNP
jgi:hypothetical protein